MSAPPLLTCPFCGAYPHIYAMGKTSRSGGWMLVCSGPGCPVELDCPQMERKDAIAKWNTRVPATPSRADQGAGR